MNRNFLIGIAGIMTFMAAHANAADVVVEPEPMPILSSFNWSGGYIGGQVGYGFGKAKFSENAKVDNTRPRGFLGGIYAGYNFDIGSNLILGIDGDFSGSKIDGTGSATSDSTVDGRLKTNLRWSGAIRPRVGYAIDRFLPYIAGGVAFGNIKDNVSLNNPTSATQRTFSQQKTKTGWTIGGGVDYAATDNVILRVEYRYTDFRNRNLEFGNGDFKQKLTTNDIRLGVAYKF
ncbi:outer membrane protein [Ochrobactrum teleogrylli]|uniref:Porin family protein n=1 Tax=Ochrobactrum teleogrylli TaxID=2479765 RepID=A0ABY2Y6K3_9HYPH|nr:outer membrane protein [[Ochrobactrum] teleogrylli]TNV17165.1 porin family protein [[Ochrobactrum] teleogrylli]